MNGSGSNRYSKDWEKTSRRLRQLYDCFNCSEDDFNNKEGHHIDNDTKNSERKNIIVLCKKCHKKADRGELIIPDNFKGYPECGVSVTVARCTTSTEDWFDSKSPLKLFPGLPGKIAMEFRKQHVKGFVTPGACNYYIGVCIGNKLFGVMGFKNPAYGNLELLLKADTAISKYKGAIDLLLYMLRTKEIQRLLEKRFSRKIQSVVSVCFSKNYVISRYRKHAELIKKTEGQQGYNLAYQFNLGTISTLKEAKSTWMQKNGYK